MTILSRPRISRLPHRLQSLHRYNLHTMTLIEVLVVLSILAAITGIALSGASETISFSQESETIRRLETIRNAVMGNSDRNYGRFIADMGRVPAITIIEIETDDGKEIDPGLLLSELWDSSFSSTTKSLGDSTYSDSTNTPWPNDEEKKCFPLGGDIKLRIGWRGPYMPCSNPDDFHFYDGFGENWITNGNDYKTISDGKLIYKIQSNGMDKKSDGDDNLILSLGEFDDDGANPYVYTANLNITVNDSNGDPLDISSYPKLRAVIFTPYVSTTNSGAGTQLGFISLIHDIPEESGGDEEDEYGTDIVKYTSTDTTAYIIPGSKGNSVCFNNIVFENLAPGIRVLYTYAIKSDNTSCYYDLRAIELTPGTKALTITLTHNKTISP